MESLVGPERILSRTIVTPDPGSRRISPAITVASSVTLDFLATC